MFNGIFDSIIILRRGPNRYGSDDKNCGCHAQEDSLSVKSTQREKGNQLFRATAPTKIDGSKMGWRLNASECFRLLPELSLLNCPDTRMAQAGALIKGALGGERK